MTGKSWITVTVLAAACALAWPLVRAANSPGGNATGSAPAEGSEVFTTAHPTVIDSFRSLLGLRREPVQPIAFTHTVHLANGLECDNCHMGTDSGPQASLPSVKFCMSCHMVIAVDRPEIKKIAAYQARGEEIPWVRVYDYDALAHVRFNHAPHIRAQVACSTCHGDMNKQTTAKRVVDLNMGYCISCHQQRKASVECVTCHY